MGPEGFLVLWFFCRVCSKRTEMPTVLAALCIPCILNIDLCCLCINSKPEIKLYLKLPPVLRGKRLRPCRLVSGCRALLALLRSQPQLINGRKKKNHTQHKPHFES